MKKIFVLMTSLLLVIPMYAIGVDYESVINAEATINKDITPDTVRIKFYVTDSGMNINDIKEKNDKTVNKAITEIKKILGPDDSIKTVSYRINNVYSYKEKVRIFQKYEVTNGFEVKSKELNKISDIIKIATDNGVKRVEQLNFSLSDSESVCNGLMAETAKMAKTRAQHIANATGNDLLKVKNINTYCSLSSSYVQPRLYANKMLSAGMAQDTAEAAIESIEPGSINVRANANVSYYLK